MFDDFATIFPPTPIAGAMFASEQAHHFSQGVQEGRNERQHAVFGV
jgi:hypothetical protein